MHFLVNVSKQIESLAEESREILQKIFESPALKAETTSLEASENLVELSQKQDGFFLIEEGGVRFSVGEEFLFLFEPGDLCCLDFHSQVSEAKISSDFSLKVRFFQKASFLSVLSADPNLSKAWLEYMSKQSALFLCLSASLLKAGVKPDADIQTFEDQQVIIEQGSSSKEVYTMIEGSAEVRVDGLKVGEVRSDQIFGALAAMTGTPRSASVVATEASTVLVIDEKQFDQLIRSRPETAMKLCKDMAETIDALNHKLVDLSQPKNQSIS